MLTRFRLFLVSTVFLAIFWGLAPSAYAINETNPLFTRLHETTVIPVEISSRAMYVLVMINDKGPFRMLVDTGCSVSLISPAVAQAVDAQEPTINGEEEGDVVVNGVGHTATLPRVLLDSVAIGSVRWEGVM